jgi:hypothetical protein
MSQPDPAIVISEPTHLLTAVFADGHTEIFSWCEKPVEKMTASGKMWVNEGDDYGEKDAYLVILTEHGGATVIPKHGLRWWRVRTLAEQRAEIAFKAAQHKAREERIAERVAAEDEVERQAQAARRALRSV